MRKEKPGAPTNRIIATLPTTERNDLRRRCKLAELEPGEVIAEPGQQIRQVYFPTSASISTIAMVDGQNSLEVSLVGREGMYGIPLALGVSVSSWRATVLCGGSALRMSAEDFHTMLNISPGLRRVLQRYTHVIVSQIAQVAVCACYHLVESRLARWMLMTHDRVSSDTFHVTHELLAEMLGVRRAGVSTAAGSLQTREVISYTRGKVTVLDRKGLEAAACDCYAASEKVYASFLG
ncbi:MAG TPA: Crp/Fnr family transcriptional regulator [Gammaproteobacteria bacterium]